jgi:plastocyanin
MGATRPAAAIGGVCALLLGAGCGSDSETKRVTSEPIGGTGTGTNEAISPVVIKPVTVPVMETDFLLTPTNITVATPGVVKLKPTNNGKVVHALEVEGPRGEVKTRPIKPGKSATLKVDLGKPGSYTWYCPIDNHKAKGMQGKITVSGGKSGGGGGTGEGVSPTTTSGG